MNDSEIFGGGWVAGRLLSVGEHPVMVAQEDATTVHGEVYQVSQGHLEELDRTMETVATIVGNGGCQRVRVVAREVKLNHPPMEVWTWQWHDVEGPQQIVTSGDWLNPGLAPWFTIIAFCCLVFVPSLATVTILIETASARKGTASIPQLLSWIGLGLSITSPMAGLYAAYIAHRRKERWSGCLLLIVLALAGILLILGMSLSKVFL
jgi:gamma-glutamylcyclotransferase (GGCT)/AIG2-like uncharacterized protein YtfP